MKINEEIGFKYWDLFKERIEETIDCIKNNKRIPIRRVALHLTNKCNLRCSYCNEYFSTKNLSLDLVKKIIDEFSEIGGGILHITGGEPTTVPYLSNIINYCNEFDNVNLNLNTNTIKRLDKELYSKINRLKVSLDTNDSKYFDNLVGMNGAFNKVIDNLSYIHNMDDGIRPCVSITYTVTKENYKNILDFLKMYYEKFPNFYAVFFSCYKGTNERFIMEENDINFLFDKIVPEINKLAEINNDKETKFLFRYSHNKDTFKNDIRFPENKEIPCYISMSEVLINEKGDIWNCSHLFRDKISSTGLNIKDIHLKDLISDIPKQNHEKCLYGCNKKLIAFNQEVHNRL